ncbi:hypothetical protein HMPREF9318_00389 [Streptococcus urinalis FB127-CNA-2]|uniref:Uncharacterized protein n=1 Tax=Streptococcus urinalis 2285-97 TaxID=764291 RepID=G5KFY1_9STRE|nr:DUF5960 family protein [Streptococcus urinalis]EHJ56610.1 hypothetical protein STRUR_1140 [Streptococcus urinalis 2285-97]EKS22191.1 hypothetical protein HMPREF9318_00389 [Streptococcus urinalis FB127-CNA-2]VEF32003.1 Uncharacterised protein [Streptococcus urinalis]
MNYWELSQNALQFDYFSANYLKFERDYYRLTTYDIPLTFIGNDILTSMAMAQRSYFRLNKEYASDKQDHYFYFKLKDIKENKIIRVYEYLGHSLKPPKP